jgi:L-idonate 5-dehydrogenase
MRGIIIHAPRDLRIEPCERQAPAAGEVRIAIVAGGICGSDLHYYHHGGFGTVRIQHPMALGHEIAGTVAEVGPGVTGLALGQRVAVNPSQPCGRCRFCQQGLQNHCLDMRFMGSAMRIPHVHGGFRQSVTVPASSIVPIPERLSMAEAAMAEPLSVCLHAARRAGELLGKRVLITGCGPIGALVAICARHAGAVEIVVTDIAPQPLAIAAALGVTRTINIAQEPDALTAYGIDKGYFDVMFEASGNQQALRAGLDALRPRAVLVQLGLGGEMTLPVNTLVAKEIELRGTFRFHEEFPLAVNLMGSGHIDVKPLITATLPFEDAIAAFELASDRTRAMKVQLSF